MRTALLMQSVVIFAIIVSAVVLVSQPIDEPATPKTPESAATSNLSGEPLRALPRGYREYRDNILGFAFHYPEEDAIREVDDGGGAKTIVIENKTVPRGLQIFIVPYTEETISEERFKADVPSGVREDAAPTTVGEEQITAVAFTSFHPSLGETHEVWFIKNGYLFEITTLPRTDDWFIPILNSIYFYRN